MRRQINARTRGRTRVWEDFSCGPQSSTQQETDGRVSNAVQTAFVRVMSLKHRTSSIILVLPLGMGVKVLLLGGGPDILSYPLRYAPPSANCHVLVNSWCSLVTFIMHLKQKAQVPPEGEKTWRAWGQGDLRVP